MSEFDASEFVDKDFQPARKAALSAATLVASPAESRRAPTREEVEARVTEMQQKLAELRQTQQELERERANLEELRRRQAEFITGRQEMVQSLTRGVGLLEEAEFAARRDAEQMAKTLVELRDALAKIQSIQEETWTKDNLTIELTRASTIIENARMEWNAARLKFPVLGETEKRAPEASSVGRPGTLSEALGEKSYAELCKLGLALTWPIALPAVAIVVALVLKR
ncbi:MAG TPA: hypothetical protein VNO52_05945 [Methylomirabilota bacterium]|nr:hypothetical protein [Methylomirabilota bacterium]